MRNGSGPAAPACRAGVRAVAFAMLAVAILLPAPAQAQALAFDAASVGGPVSNARAELFAPPGDGPFPAVVVLHGCDGVGPHYRTWARQLRAWGYVALVVDSFRPRGVTNVCTHGSLLPPRVRALDALAAAQYLRTLPTVRADRIGAIGFSHGGATVLRAVLADAVAESGALPFAAAVAFYPGCDPPTAPLASDTLILIGDADDWTPAARCTRWRERAQPNGHALRFKLYSGALHGFDAPTQPHVYMGHQVGRDPEAAADALIETRRFLAERLLAGDSPSAPARE